MARERVVCLVCLLFLLSLSTAAEVRAQAGTIEIFGDATLTSCAIIDAGGLVQVYIAHVFTPAAQGVRFLIDYSSTTMTNVGETSPFAKMGESAAGVTICYGACLAGPIQILTINFFASGTTPACTFITVQPHLEDGQILGLDCDWNLMFPTGGAAVVNPDGTCYCTTCLACGKETGESQQSTANHFCAWVPVEKTTWGQIKSMYE